MQKIKKYLKENKSVAAVMGIMFGIALIYNTLSPYTTDDYTYMYSFYDKARITNPLQIFSSLWSHYLTINGRILPHVFVQFFAMFPKWVFNIVNAVAYVSLIYMVLQIACEKKINALMFAALPVAFWQFVPAYGCIFLWMTGSANYFWGYLFSLIYMKVYVDLYRNPNKIFTRKGMTIFSIASLLFGAYSEMISFPVVFACFILLCITMYEEKNIKKYWSYVIPVVTAACGYLTMVFCPAEVTVKEGLTLGYLFKNLIDIFETYYLCVRELLIIWAILLVIAIWFKADRKLQIISGCFLGISVISMMMLSVARYVVARHYATPVFFLITAIVVLMQSLRGRGHSECVVYCICAYIMAANIWSLWDGTYDIYDVYRKSQARDSYIYEQVENGNNDTLTVPVIVPLTKYSCKYELMDLRMDDADQWPNAEIAKYYGLKKIYGKKAE